MNALPAIAKVLATGQARPGYLRATIMLTPSVRGLDGVLPTWPRDVIMALRGKPQSPWKVTLAARRHSPSKLVDAPLAPDETFEASASSMRGLWEGEKSQEWLVELWRDAFFIKPNTGDQREFRTREIWLALAEVLETSASNSSYKAGKLSQSKSEKGRTSPDDRDAPVRETAPGNSKTVIVEGVLPSQQGDLAVVLELKRARELCNTIWWAHGDLRSRHREEAECCAQQNASTVGTSQALDPSVILREAAAAVFQQASPQIACPVKKQKTLESSEALAAKPIADLDQAMNRSIDSHEAATQRQAMDQLDVEQPESVWRESEKGWERVLVSGVDFLADAVGQRFYAIQGSPALSRLFGLTIDVEFPASAIPSLGDEEYLYLSVADEGLFDPVPRFPYLWPKPPTIWSVAKYRSDPDGSYFWPASRAELGALDAGKCPPDFFNQYDGLLVLGQRFDTLERSRFRFDLTSLDVRAAAEAEIDKRRARTAARESTETAERVKVEHKETRAPTLPAGLTAATAAAAKSPTPTASVVAQTPPTTPSISQNVNTARKTFRTAGLTLIDLGRQEQAVTQLAVSTKSDRLINPPRSDKAPQTRQDYVVIDSEDLCVGYRMDIGVRLREPKKYEWRTLMARELTYGVGGMHAGRVGTSIGKLLPYRSSGDWTESLFDGVIALPARLIPRGGDSVDAYVEEAVATWNGEPMAVQCGGARSSKVLDCDLGIGYVARLPTSSESSHRAPPALRFGWPYRVGIRIVYPGGISIPLSTAKRAYEGADSVPATGVLAYPPRDPKRGELADRRRFLRHERIDSPYLLMAERLATRSPDVMGRERAAHAIIRTSYGKKTREREAPTSTQRIFAVPNVSQVLAGLHGVFDHVAEAHPPQGLRGVRFDAEAGGFPVVLCDTITGINGEPYESPARISTELSDQGDLVFSISPEKRPRKTPYYPDPAATEYAIGIRYAGTESYLDGGPFKVPIYDSARKYPNARPLVIAIERAKSNKRLPPGRRRLDDVLTRTTAGSANGLGSIGEVPHGIGVECTLLPGDDFEIDVWCVPNKDELARKFALIESIGAAAVAQGTQDSKQSEDLILRALQSLLPEPFCASYAKHCQDQRGFHNSRSDLTAGFRSVGGLVAPGVGTLEAIAFAVYDTLCARPLDEISAFRTLRATHASDQPRLAPEFQSEPVPFRVARKSPKESGEDATRVGNLAQIGYAIQGSVAIDLATTGSFEIVARTVSPTSSAFDDISRRRSIRDRRKGDWPHDLGNKLREPLDVFGFDVDPSGNVTLPEFDLSLLQVDGLPTVQAGDLKTLPDGRSLLPLDGFFGGTNVTSLGIVKKPYIFPDKKARRLELRVRAYSRHAILMQTAKRPARNGKWLRAGKDLDSEDVLSESGTLQVWMPADIRPAKPVARSPLPAFCWIKTPAASKRGITHVSRTSVIRIPLNRGWYSSGDGEVLGIVIWPPDLFTQPRESLVDDKVMSVEARQMTLDTFEDDDLGPGGAFITRWGGDPIRTAKDDRDQPRRGRTFVLPEAFADYSQPREDGFKAELVEGVEMPIEDSRGTKANADLNAVASPGDSESDVTKIGTESPETTLLVSLLTYCPRFDVEAEEWYVDIRIECSHEAEPFVRFGLVRYQANASKEKRVSYPITQWAQLLPRRDVEVESSLTATEIQSFVRIRGLAVERGPTDSASDTAKEIVEAKQVMAARLVREHRVSPGGLVRQVISELDLAPNARLTSLAENYQCVWEGALPSGTRQEDRDRIDKATYYVFIEEYEERRSATYPVEPFTVGATLPYTQSGPRFQVRVDLRN